MPMIQGIDGGALLQMFRQGREDRYASDKRLRDQQDEDRKRERDEQLRGVMANLYGEQQKPASVASSYGAPQAAASPTAATAPQTFGEAFSPASMDAIGNGEAPPAPATAAPPVAPPQLPAQAPRREVNRDVLRQLIVLDPEKGGQVASVLKSLDEMDLKRIESRNNYMGAAARYVAQGTTPQERVQRFEIAKPHLMEAGYSPQELDGIEHDLSDQRLQFFMGTAIDYDKLVDNELAEREANQPKIITPQAGAGAFARDPRTGQMTTLVAPNDGSHAFGEPAGGGHPAPPAEAVAHLKSDPATAAQFDEVFGPGAAARALGQGGPTAQSPSGPFPD